MNTNPPPSSTTSSLSNTSSSPKIAKHLNWASITMPVPDMSKQRWLQPSEVISIKLPIRAAVGIHGQSYELLDIIIDTHNETGQWRLIPIFGINCYSPIMYDIYP